MPRLFPIFSFTFSSHIFKHHCIPVVEDRKQKSFEFTIYVSLDSKARFFMVVLCESSSSQVLIRKALNRYLGSSQHHSLGSRSLIEIPDGLTATTNIIQRSCSRAIAFDTTATPTSAKHDHPLDWNLWCNQVHIRVAFFLSRLLLGACSTQWYNSIAFIIKDWD